MPLKLKTLPEIKFKIESLLETIFRYMEEPDYDEIELERAVDFLLSKLPRTMFCVEWFDRSDIKNMADGVYDEPASEDLVDLCMKQLRDFNIMQNETVESIVADTVREHKGL